MLGLDILQSSERRDHQRQLRTRAKNSRCPGRRRGCRWERGASVTCKHLLVWEELQQQETLFHVYNNPSRVQTSASEDTLGLSEFNHECLWGQCPSLTLAVGLNFPAGQSWVTADRADEKQVRAKELGLVQLHSPHVSFLLS